MRNARTIGERLFVKAFDFPDSLAWVMSTMIDSVSPGRLFRRPSTFPSRLISFAYTRSFTSQILQQPNPMTLAQSMTPKCLAPCMTCLV